MTDQRSLLKFAMLPLLLFSLHQAAYAREEFQVAATYGVGMKPSAAVVGDFNSDGKPDVVVANSGNNNVSVLLNNGGASLQQGLTYRVGSNPQSVAVGDFNGDGALDVVVANFGSNNISVLLGNGDGSFRHALNYRVGTGPQSLVVGDFDADGKLDLAVVNFASNNLSLLFGNGDGSFAPAQNYHVGTAPQAVVAGDFDGNGALDLAVANSGSNNVSVLLGKGDGTFRLAVNYAVGASPSSLSVGDLDGDRTPDLVVTNNGSKNVSVLLANGDGTFRKAVGYNVGTKAQAVAAGDFNGNGNLGLAVANPAEKSVGVLSGRGDGSFQIGKTFNAGPGPSFVATGDLNGDGAPDLVVVDAISNNVTLLLNSPVIQLTPGSLKFAARPVGTPSPAMTVKLANSGSGPLAVKSIRFIGNNPRDFTQTSNCPLMPFWLAANQTCTLSLTFTPNAKGTRKAALTVTDNAAGSPHSVTLSAGNPAPGTTWVGGAGNWSDPSKWTAGVPTSGTDAFIDSSNPLASPVALDIGGQTNNLTIDSDDSLSFNNGTSLTINGSSISNAGAISLNSAGSLTTLFVATGATLTGTGTVTMSNNSANQVDGNGGATLTNQSTIQGVGAIGPHFTLANQGTVNANVNGAILALGEGNAPSYTNTATLEATNGGILQINTGGSGSINNAGGTIKAVGTNSQVQFPGSGNIITGGTLSSSGGGTIVQTAGSSTLTGLTNAATLSILNGGTVNLSGTITNTGTFQLNSTGSLTELFVPTAATLAGTGKVIMSNNPFNAVDGNGGATLTNQSIIQGVGTIGSHFVLVNQGTVNANVAAGILALRQDTGATDTNTATLEATNGGILQIGTTGTGGGINNTGGTIKAVGTNSQVQFTNGTSITGGTLSSSNGGTIVQPSGSSTLTTLTNAGTLSILNNATVNLSGTLTNTGTIQVNSTGSLTLLNVPTGNVTLTGNGSVVLNNNPNSTIDGNGGLTFTNQSTIQGGGTIGPHFTFNNKGTLNVTAANTLNINAPFVNFSGTTLKGGKYQVSGTLQFTGANIVTNAANLTLTGTTSQIVDQNNANGLANFAVNAAAGVLTLAGGRTLTTAAGFRNVGTVDITPGTTFSITGRYTQTAGNTIVDGTLRTRGISIQAGTVFGSKTLGGNLQSSGSITPGDSATQTAKLAVIGTYTQNSTGSLNISIGGLTAGTQYGQLNVTQAASLDGLFNISLINAFVPNIGDTFNILNASSVTGTFATVNSLCINSSESFTITYNPTGVVLTVVSGACT